MPENPLRKLRLIAYNAQKEDFGRHVPEGQHDWFLAEKCARHVAITLNPNVAISPVIIEGDAKTKSENISFTDDRSATRIEVGEDAYAYLLMMMAGLLNQRTGDMHAKGKVLANYNKLRAKGWLQDGLANLMDKLFSDYKRVHEMALSKLETCSTVPAVAARALINMKKGDEVLIVGDNNKITVDTFKALGNHCAKIHIMPPDNESLDVTRERILREQKQYTFPIEIEVHDPKKLTPDFMKKVRHIFVCNRMGMHPGFEKKLVDQWKQHGCGHSHLVHLKKYPHEPSSISKMWEELEGSDGFVDRNILDEQHRQVEERNKSVFEVARNACRNCAHTRNMGDGSKDPIKMFLTLPPEQYAQQTSRQVEKMPN